MPNRNEYLYPRSSYHGEVKPQNVVFNANLQEFAHKVSYICNLETGGKLEPIEAYHLIKNLWEDLKTSKKLLKIGEERGIFSE